MTRSNQACFVSSTTREAKEREPGIDVGRIWTDDDVMAKTVDYTNTSLVAVCYSMESHDLPRCHLFLCLSGNSYPWTKLNRFSALQLLSLPLNFKAINRTFIMICDYCLDL